MLISFEVENFLSFKNNSRYQGFGSLEKQHGSRVGRSKRYRLKTLPVSVMYGGNASGKSNFVKAIDFFRNTVLNPVGPGQRLPTRQFRLSDQSLHKPSRFAATLLLEVDGREVCYEYGFSVDSFRVHSEWLIEVLGTSEKKLFSRTTDELGASTFDWGAWKNRLGTEERSFLEFVSKGTGKERLFLSESVTRNIDRFAHIYSWLQNNLVILYPQSKPRFMEMKIHDHEPLKHYSDSLLRDLDTGIFEIRDMEVPFDALGIPDEVKDHMRTTASENTRITTPDIHGNRYSIKMEKGELTARKLVAFHKSEEGRLVEFEIRHESQGSQRLIELIPAFHDLSQNNNLTFVIDELDRSLHPDATKALVELFLSSCDEDSRRQLIFTTHDQGLLSQDVFRRDEIWFVDRDSCGVSSMRSLSDFKKERSDKDIRKAYQMERFGGIPRIRISH